MQIGFPRPMRQGLAFRIYGTARENPAPHPSLPTRHRTLRAAAVVTASRKNVQEIRAIAESARVPKDTIAMRQAMEHEIRAVGRTVERHVPIPKRHDDIPPVPGVRP
eukprot:13554398-Heterocapsa_arctica.AAC.1